MSPIEHDGQYSRLPSQMTGSPGSPPVLPVLRIGGPGWVMRGAQKSSAAGGVRVIPAPAWPGRGDRRREGEGGRVHPAAPGPRRRFAGIAGWKGSPPRRGRLSRCPGRLLADPVRARRHGGRRRSSGGFDLPAQGRRLTVPSSSPPCPASSPGGRADRLDARPSPGSPSGLAGPGVVPPPESGAARPDPHPVRAGPRPHPRMAAAGEATRSRPGSCCRGRSRASPPPGPPASSSRPSPTARAARGPWPPSPPGRSRAAAPPSSRASRTSPTPRPVRC